MTEPTGSAATSTASVPNEVKHVTRNRIFDLRFALRRGLPAWQSAFMGLVGVLVCLALWWFLTNGPAEERIIPPSKGLSSPAETFRQLP